jgi:hypothetical protein
MKTLAAVCVMAAMAAACAGSTSQGQSAPPAAATSGAPAKAQSCVRDLDCAADEVCYQNQCHR